MNILNKLVIELNREEQSVLVDIMTEILTSSTVIFRDYKPLMYQVFDLGNLAFKNRESIRSWKDRVGKIIRGMIGDYVTYLYDYGGYRPIFGKRNLPVSLTIRSFFVRLENRLLKLGKFALTSGQYPIFKEEIAQIIKESERKYSSAFETPKDN